MILPSRWRIYPDPTALTSSDNGDWCKWKDIEPLLARIEQQKNLLETLGVRGLMDEVVNLLARVAELEKVLHRVAIMEPWQHCRTCNEVHRIANEPLKDVPWPDTAERDRMKEELKRRRYGCCCVLSEDQEEVLEWCAIHGRERDRMKEENLKLTNTLIDCGVEQKRLEAELAETIASHQKQNARVDEFENVFCDEHLENLPKRCPACELAEARKAKEGG